MAPEWGGGSFWKLQGSGERLWHEPAVKIVTQSLEHA
eukprot:CAMPEP_0118964256 /NCGR_PEP_ID=MMETSP1173-20130426/1982_1 /TAXON_ID=1034831 /ORGANISM="Rhizochromulina marina cf, Strain CCMP1243" /LENGTH=36 /DNA_ID= /DNA_START= /DNA_END= /DNA_ORIENTATION=